MVRPGTVLRVPSSAPQDSGSLRPLQRTGAYAVVTDEAGAVLLVRGSDRSDLAGVWSLPGGGLRHGEHPHDAVQRELLEETGLRAAAATVRDARSDLIDLPYAGVTLHTLRLIYDVTVLDRPARPRPELDGTSDLARFVPPAQAATLPLMPFVAQLLGLPEPAPLRPAAARRPMPPDPALDVPVEPEVDYDVDVVVQPAPAGEIPFVVQRPAAYAVLIDENARAGDGSPEPRMLLTRLTGGREVWTLPGGGIDHGEPPLVALERELHEETGLPYRPGPLLDIGSRHFVGRSPEGRLEDFHGLRLVYAGSVPFDQPPQVIEVGGSTDLAAWIPIAELGRIGVVATVRESLVRWQQYQAQR